MSIQEFKKLQPGNVLQITNCDSIWISSMQNTLLFVTAVVKESEHHTRICCKFLRDRNKKIQNTELFQHECETVKLRTDLTSVDFNFLDI